MKAIFKVRAVKAQQVYEVGRNNSMACTVFPGCSGGGCGSMQESRATELSPRHCGF